MNKQSNIDAEIIDTAEEIIYSLRDISQDVLVKTDTSFRYDLGLTSIDIAEIIAALEARYNTNLDVADAKKIDCIEDVLRQCRWEIVRAKSYSSNDDLKKFGDEYYENSPVYKKVKELIIKTTGIKAEVITPKSRIEKDLELDAIDMDALVVELCDFYKITIYNQDKIFVANTVSEITDCILDYIAPSPQKYAKRLLLREISDWLVQSGLVDTEKPVLQTKLNIKNSNFDSNVFHAIEKKYNIKFYSLNGLYRVDDLLETIIQKRLDKYQKSKKVCNNNVEYGKKEEVNNVETFTGKMQKTKARFTRYIQQIRNYVK